MLETRLTGPTLPLAYAKFLTDKSALIIARNEHEVSTLAQELCFYAPELKERLLVVPDSETLPFDLERAPASIMSERWYALNLIASKPDTQLVVISSAPNCMRLVAEPRFWKDSKVTLKVGEALPLTFSSVTEHYGLKEWGYSQTKKVTGPGEFACRGRVFDLYPIGICHLNGRRENMAVRIYLDEKDSIQRIARLDCLTNESSPIDISHLDVYPNREYPITRETVEAFRKEVFNLHDSPRQVESYSVVSESKDHPELLSWVGSIPSAATSLLDFHSFEHILEAPGIDQAIEDQWSLIESRHLDVSEDSSRFCPPISMSWISPSQVKESLATKPEVFFASEPKPSGMQRLGSLDDALELLTSLVKAGNPTLFVMNSEVRMRHMKVMLTMVGVRAKAANTFEAFVRQPAGYAILKGNLLHGYFDQVSNYRVITEMEVFGTSIETSLDIEVGEYQRKAILQGLDEIQIDDPVVHATYGRGLFAGFETMKIANLNEDMIRIKFANDITNFVKISDLDQVSRYSGSDAETMKLSKLGDESWRKGLNAAQNSALEVARQLILIRNARNRANGVILEEPGPEYLEFAETFEYEETPDQKRAIADIIEDLTSGRPMDRLIVGDVGFGKTEVSLRPAFLMASQGYQVALLAPTGILATQHYQTTKKRFENTSIKVILAESGSLTKEKLDILRNGEPCIIIGTHRLLQNDVIFERLGLYIIDEEHRFGVRQKEALRSLRGNKHVLAMTATPIPRTLGMAMSGIRSISILSTPPARRLSVRTIVRTPGNGVLREAIGRELAREGQVFFVHNNIDTMDHAITRIHELFPKARIGKMHGRMHKDEITATLVAYQRHEFDIMVSTTIVEVGIDIPNANTMIVDEAEHFGLGQLHQLRGRVGRSDRQAYCYLLSTAKPGTDGFRRMEAMKRSSKLGEGILLARQDLEIRGLGEILGDEQSGHIHNIGFSLYMRLLEQAIKVLDENPNATPAELMVGNVDMPVVGVIPESFMPDNGSRLAWYQRLMASESKEELTLNLKALEDMYGYLPAEVLEFGRYVESHIAMKRIGIEVIQPDGQDTRITVSPAISQLKAEVLLKVTFNKALDETDRARSFVIRGKRVAEVINELMNAG
ncbi:DEAD/DEAH box helicase [Pseudomonas aeruginosa]